MRTNRAFVIDIFMMGLFGAAPMMMACPDNDSGSDAGTDSGSIDDTDAGSLVDAGNLNDAGSDSDAGSGNGGNGPVTDPIGGCVLSSTTGVVPSNLYDNTGIVQSADYAPFTKILTVRGITLMGRADNEDAFMLNVASLIEEIFPGNGNGLNNDKQEEVIRHMYERRTAIPLFKGDDDISFGPGEEEQFDLLTEQNSICDVIFETGQQGQTMEVVEHILHHITMVGLHYAYFNEWGVNEISQLHGQMQNAISEGYYDVSDYQGIPEEERLRILLQEYAYWVISTAWDVQETYGPGGSEWTLPGLAAFQQYQPDMYALIQSTVDQVMAPPSSASLAVFE
jgi:hypothetical protein